jgi:hypothetical protein
VYSAIFAVKQSALNRKGREVGAKVAKEFKAESRQLKADGFFKQLAGGGPASEETA